MGAKITNCVPLPKLPRALEGLGVPAGFELGCIMTRARSGILISAWGS